MSWLSCYSKKFFKGRNKGFPGEGPEADSPKGSSAPTLTEQKALKKGQGLRLSKRGVGAFDNPNHSALASSVGGTNRLHAHACTDDTSIKHYIPAVRKFLLWINWFAPPIITIAQKDSALADYLAFLCYDEQVGLSTGLHAFSGFNAIYPECIGRMPEAGRGVKAWQKLEVLGEGAPIPWEGVGAIAGWMRSQKSQKFSIAADLCLIAADCYLRQSDWALANHEDLSVSLEHGVALHLGIPERGESTKTGVRQGIRPDFEGVSDLLQKYKAKSQPGGRLFLLTPAEFSSCWRKACAGLQYDAGPPHTLRHVGPSHDMLSGYRTLDQVRVRGRWRAKTSVLRYAKTHTLIAAETRFPDRLRNLGLAHLQRFLGGRSSSAIN